MFRHLPSPRRGIDPVPRAARVRMARELLQWQHAQQQQVRQSQGSGGGSIHF